jgi:hypothetical protein
MLGRLGCARVIFGAAAIALAASAVVMKSRRLIGMERILDWRLPIGNCRLVAYSRDHRQGADYTRNRQDAEPQRRQVTLGG